MAKDLIDNIIKDDEAKRNDLAIKLFNKPYCQLGMIEQERVEDELHPIWKPVKTYKGDVVEVSNTGLVRNIDDKRLYTIYYPFKMYPIISITGYGEKYVQPVHRLVAQAFVPNPENKPEVNHIDGDKTHNWYKNLEWVTHGENIKKAFEIGLHKSMKGEKNGSAKYTNDQIRQVCELLRDRPDLSFKEIEGLSGVSSSVIKDVYKYRRWKVVSKEYDFPPRKTKVGIMNGRAIYTEDQARSVCDLLEKNYNGETRITQQAIANQIGVSRKMVEKISQGLAWVHVAKNYRFYQDHFGIKEDKYAD